MGLEEQLAALPPNVKERIDKRGFDPEQLLRWAGEMKAGREARNVLRGDVQPVREGLAEVPRPGTAEHQRLSAIGAQSLANGELAVCVLAGGMATRMGGVVKALVHLHAGFTFIDVPLAERQMIKRRHSRAPALWLMTSEPTHGPITDALAGLTRAEAEDVAPFEQFVSLRLCEDGNLFLDDKGEPSVYATGHGDLPDALKKSGLLGAFVERGGRHVWISNLDNVGGRIDEAILGQHIESGAALTVELVDKRPGDKGGGPVMHNRKPIIAEHFRLPRDFVADAVPVFNTNTFLVDARALAELDMSWTYVEVRKDVGQQKAVQFERLLGEMTVAIRPRFLRVPREGDRNRFIGLKSQQDMEAEAPAIERLVDTLRQGSASG